MEIGRRLVEKRIYMGNPADLRKDIFGLYWNGIYAILSEGKHNNNKKATMSKTAVVASSMANKQNHPRGQHVTSLSSLKMVNLSFRPPGGFLSN